MTLLTVYRILNFIGWFLAGVFLSMYLHERNR